MTSFISLKRKIEWQKNVQAVENGKTLDDIKNIGQDN